MTPTKKDNFENWNPITLENIAEHPMHFESRSQLECTLKEKGLTRDR